MKFAFCLFKYFPFGGLQRDFLRIAEECIQRGHQVDVYTMHWEGEKLPALKLTTLPVRGWQNHTRARYFASQLQSHLSAKIYDCIVGFNKMPGLDVYYAADTCFQAKAYKKRAHWYRYLPRYQHAVQYEKAVFAKESATQILLISPSAQLEFHHFYATPAERFHLLPPGIAKDRMAPSNAKELRDAFRYKMQIAPDNFLLLMIGSGFKTKGLDRILQGIAALPDALRQRVDLFILGQDNPGSFQRLAKKLKMAAQTHFLGGRDDIADWLLAGDLLLHPAYYENTGTVLLEALAAGLPILTTENCGYAHYIQKANAGIVLPMPFSQQIFNQTLADMLLASSARTIWQQNGRHFARLNDLYSMPERAVDIIETVGIKRAS